MSNIKAIRILLIIMSSNEVWAEYIIIPVLLALKSDGNSEIHAKV